MTPTQIAESFAQHYNTSLPKADVTALAEIIIRQEVTKGEQLLPMGHMARNILYVERGLIRQYYYKNGIDISEHFSAEEDVVYCTESMLMRQPTELMIEALEDGVVHNIPFDKFQALCKQSRPILELYVKLLEDGLLCSLSKSDAQRFESAEERYEKFIQHYPEAAKRASGKHIASYLLMTPESLSRVKSKLSKR